MKENILKFLDYFLPGVLSVLPILVVVQIVSPIERLLRDTFLSIHGYYENCWLTAFLFAITILLLIFLGYRIRDGKGKTYMVSLLVSYLEKLPILSIVYRVSKKSPAYFPVKVRISHAKSFTSNIQRLTSGCLAISPFRGASFMFCMCPLRQTLLLALL